MVLSFLCVWRKGRQGECVSVWFLATFERLADLYGGYSAPSYDARDKGSASESSL